MILRIFYTDRYQRQAKGKTMGTPGLRGRLAKQFDVSPEVIKKITGLKDNQHGQKRRVRFSGIAIKTIKRRVQNHLGVPRRKPGRPQ